MADEKKHERQTVVIPPVPGAMDRSSYYTCCTCGDPRCEKYKEDTHD